jgi:uncharacterized protein YoxC
MKVTIDIMTLGVTIGIILLLILFAYILYTLVKLNKTINTVNLLLDSNKKEIDNTLKMLPGICENIGSITTSVKGKADMIDNLFVKNEEAAATLDVESIVTTVSSVVELFTEVKNLFSKKKKRFLRKL